MPDPGLAGWLGVVALALAVHVLVFRALRRLLRRADAANRVLTRARWPARGLTATLAALLARPQPLAHGAEIDHALVLVAIALAAWVAFRAVEVAGDALLERQNVGVRDNRRARKLRTRIGVLVRVAEVGIVLVAGSAMLMTFPAARTMGTSLLASAGIVGILAGVAGRSTLGNFVAGLQIAFSEPIRFDDVVVVEGEWGRVEEITLTYVAVRLWDNRRLVLPTTYFVEQPFQNWTRTSAAVLGTVVIHLDLGAPMGAIRSEFHRIVEADPEWDGDAALVQVVDTTERTMVVRGLVSAPDAPTSWDLRCRIREAWLDSIRRHHPHALPRLRGQGVRDAQQASAEDSDAGASSVTV